MILGGVDCPLRGIGSMVVWWCQLEVDLSLSKVLFETLWAFIIESVEHGSASALGKGVMDMLDSGC